LSEDNKCWLKIWTTCNPTYQVNITHDLTYILFNYLVKL
jgi:hypothetical protein